MSLMNYLIRCELQLHQPYLDKLAVVVDKTVNGAVPVDTSDLSVFILMISYINIIFYS